MFVVLATHCQQVCGQALITAAGRGDIKTVCKLLAHVNFINSSGYNALINAAENGNVDVVEILLAAGSRGKNKALEHALMEPHPQIAEILLKAGAKTT